MNKVFTLTVIPATRRSKELLVLSVQPGVPGSMLASAAINMDKICKSRHADGLVLKDVNVQVGNQSWFQKLKARLIKAQIVEEIK